MAGKMKRRFRVYAAWDYQQEVEDLNRASEQGLQLVRAGLFSSKFEQDSSVRYRYQADFQRLNATEMHRYLTLFEEQGWEHVNSLFNGWHYFRKRYDPSLPESAYEIYTDTASLREMRRRWTLVAVIAAVFHMLVTVCSTVMLVLRPQLPNLLYTLSFGMLLGLFLYGIVRMKRKAPRKGRSRDGVLFLIVLVLFAVVCLWLVPHLRGMRPNFNANTGGSSDGSGAVSQITDWVDFSVGYCDFYYMDLNIDAETPMTFALKNEAGETVYTLTDDQYTEDRIRLRLEAGTYHIELTCSEGYSLRFAIQ